jgi:hypothetical protein
MIPSAYSIVCVWLSLMILMTIINLLSSGKKPELYNVEGGILTSSRNVYSFEKSDLSHRSQVDDVMNPGPNILRQFIFSPYLQ